MFDDPLAWSLLFQVTSVAAVGAAVWALGRQLRNALSANARDTRRRLAQLRKIASTAGLTVDESTHSLVGRVSGWPTQVRLAKRPDRAGGLPSDVCHVTLMVAAPASVAHRSLPTAPPGLPPVRIQDELLVADILMQEAGAQMPDLLDWMATVAHSLQPPPQAHETGGRSDVGTACTQLGLRPDGVLPRWDGLWQERQVRVASLPDTAQVQVRLALRLQLPGQLYVGGQHPAGAPPGGSPVPLPLLSDFRQLAAFATPAQVRHCQELLDNNQLIAVLSEHLGDIRGSRVHAGEVVLLRPATLWAIAAGRVLQAALTTAEAMEAAVEAPWRAMCNQLPVKPTPDRQGGLPVLEGTVDGIVLRVSRDPTHDGVYITAEAPRHLLVPGLRICPRRPGEPSGLRSGNPILDQHVRIEVLSGATISPEILSRIPVDAALPLLHGGPISQLNTEGAKVSLPDHPGCDDIVATVHDLLRLLASLPRKAEL